jgi:glucokinase
MAEKDQKVVLAYDLGGTKVSVGAVTSQGKVLEEIRVPVAVEQGKAAVIRQLSDLGKDIISRHKGIKKVGMASAGPLDPDKGILLDPTNFASAAGTWGKVPIANLLSKALKKPVFLENDAAAAMLAEAWIGHAKGYNNAMILTLGTGLGTGIIVNGELVRARGGLHPEAGHMVIHEGDQSAPCGCGNLGCAEAYLSGRGFTRRSRPRFANPDLFALDISNMARKRDPRALAAFEEYAHIMAIAIHNYAVMFAPEIVVFTGSFAASADLFMDSTKDHLEKLLARRRIGFDLLPKLKVSKLDNLAGLVGAAKVAFDR